MKFPTTKNYQYLAKRSSFFRISLLPLFLLPLGFSGFCISLPQFKKLAPLHLFLGTYFLGVLFSFVTWRYRLPLALALWPFAAFLVVEVWRALRERRLALLLLSVLLVSGFSGLGRMWQVTPPMYKTDMQAAQGAWRRAMRKLHSLPNLHRMFLHRGQPQRDLVPIISTSRAGGGYRRGIEMLRHALAENPNQPHLWEVLSFVYRRIGNVAAADEATMEGKKISKPFLTDKPSDGPMSSR